MGSAVCEVYGECMVLLTGRNGPDISGIKARCAVREISQCDGSNLVVGRGSIADEGDAYVGNPTRPRPFDRVKDVLLPLTIGK